MTDELTNYKIAKLAYEDIKQAVDSLEKKHKIECGIPPFIDVNGEKFFYDQFETFVEWGGSLRCFNSEGEIINCADDLNRREREKND